MEESSIEIRKNILKIAHKSGHGHIPTCFSVIELLQSVYMIMNHKPNQPNWPERDIFILSKGHAALGLYCVLAHFGYFPIEDVYSFGKFKSNFGCHADRKKVPGIEASTGSLGHGIGIALGMAMAFKIKKSSRKVYVLIGDGESNEGSVWEAIMIASNLKLSNFTILFDNNNSQTKCLPINKPVDRFESFGCKVTEVNGHNINEIKNALIETDTIHVICANTIKGYGCKTLYENMFAWHRRSPNNEELDHLIEELNENSI